MSFNILSASIVQRKQLPLSLRIQLTTLRRVHSLHAPKTDFCSHKQPFQRIFIFNINFQEPLNSSRLWLNHVNLSAFFLCYLIIHCIMIGYIDNKYTIILLNGQFHQSLRLYDMNISALLPWNMFAWASQEIMQLRIPVIEVHICNYT